MVRPVPAAAPADAVDTSARAGETPRGILDRSGVDVRQLLLDGDLLLERSPQSRVELTVRLEAARGALVRNQPAEVLALLDESWESAQHTEQGWYLRGSALAALGLPGEALRVAREALMRRPASVALRFLGSLASLLLGDAPTARELLQEALEQAPDEPLLLAHQAVVASRAGNHEKAATLLRQAAAGQPEHPAVQYARAWVSADRANSSRSMSREASMAPAAAVPPTDGEWDAWMEMEAVEPASNDVDPLDQLLRTLGASLRERGRDKPGDVLIEARALLRAMSGGGALHAMAPAERSHTARSLLSLVVSVWSESSDERDAELHATRRADSNSRPVVLQHEQTPAQVAIRNVLRLLRNGDADGAQRTLAQSAGQLPVSMRPQLHALLDGAATPAAGRFGNGYVACTPAGVEVLTDRGLHEAHREVIGPVRLGLSLIDAGDTAAAHLLAAPRLARTLDGVDGVADRVSLGAQDAHGPIGWDAVPPKPLPRSSAKSARMVAVCCVLAAIAAVAAGKTILALALAGGASWLALRRAQRIGDTAEYHTAERYIRDGSR